MDEKLIYIYMYIYTDKCYLDGDLSKLFVCFVLFVNVCDIMIFIYVFVYINDEIVDHYSFPCDISTNEPYTIMSDGLFLAV